MTCSALLTLAAGAFASVIVVNASGAAAGRFAPGHRLRDDAVIRLADRESLTILGARGTRVFRGPGQFRPDDPVRPGARGVSDRRARARLGGLLMSSLEHGRPEGPMVLIAAASGPSAPHFPTGRALPEGMTIVLRPGDRLMTMSLQGSQRYAGPGRFRLTGERRDLASVGIVVGSIAGYLLSGPRHDVWSIDVGRSEVICVSTPAALNLRRGNASRDDVLTVTDGAGTSRAIRWPSGTWRLPWPEDVPITDGSRFRLALSGSAAPAEVTLRLLPSEASAADADLAAALTDRGCRGQVDRLQWGRQFDGRLLGARAIAMAPPEPPDLLHIDIASGGTICVPAGRSVTLWRAEIAAPLVLSIAGRTQATVEWPAGSDSLAWPAALTIRERADFELRWPGAQTPTRIVFRRIDRALGGARAGDVVALARAFADAGCTAQLERLADATMLEESNEARRPR